MNKEQNAQECDATKYKQGTKSWLHKILALIILCACFLQANAQSQHTRPNIILFLVDDMGWQDCSVAFWKNKTMWNERYYTPNMEQLAKDGMKFNSAYATPVCTPTRVSFITGMNAAHHGVTNWTSPVANNPTDNADSVFTSPDWNYNGLSSIPNEPHTVYATTLPQLLKNAGYFTVMVGKGHWGPSGMTGSNPYNLGYVVNIAAHSAGHPQSYLGEKNYGNMPGKSTVQAVPDLQEYYGTNTFLTEALTKEALKAIDFPIQNKQPFFLTLSHYAVHLPFDADDRYMNKYLAKGLDTVEAKYASLIEGMDKSLGDVMNYLKRKGADENTIIIFMSDNGGLSVPWARKGEAYTQNSPLRSGKGSVYEGGVREPMIVKWPGVVKAGTTNTNDVIIEDFFPSILEMAQVKNYKTVQTIDGVSFVPLLKNENLKQATKTLFWHFPNKWVNADVPGANFRSAVKSGDWKLVYNYTTANVELYNIKDDIGEKNDVSVKYAAKKAELLKLLTEKLNKWKSPMPFNKRTNTYEEIKIKE